MVGQGGGRPSTGEIERDAPVARAAALAAPASPNRPGRGRPRQPFDRARRRAHGWLGRHGTVTAAVAVGGAVGCLARYGVDTAIPTGSHLVPWATVTVNVAGCFAIGALIVGILDVWAGHRLLRPFLTTGLLGGFTTFSGYTADTQQLMLHGHPGIGFGYLLGMPVVAILFTWLGILAARFLTRTWRRRSA